MSSSADTDPERRLAAELRTPRAAAVAGIAFAVILTVVVVLLHQALPRQGDEGQWITQSNRRQEMKWALALVPYAGIAFLWFIGVIRSRLGDREDRFFATVFLGSGLLFVAMLFSAAASLGALLVLYNTPGRIPPDEVRLLSASSLVLLETFGIRMAAVFTLVVTNLGRRTAVVPRWLQAIGAVVAVLLLLAPPRTAWVTALFPAWVFLLSVQILITSFRPATPDGGGG